MPCYVNDLADRYSWSVALFAEDILRQMNLPVPDSYEYLSGKESTHIPLHRHGVTIRVGESARHIRSDYFLNPLLEIPLSSNVSFEILPGIKVGERGGATKYEVKFSLLFDGYDLPSNECVRSNFGTIAVVENGKCVEHDLVLDRGAVRELSRPLNLLFNAHAGAHCYRQEQVFGHYYELAEAVWDGENGKIRHTDLKRFFSICAENSRLPYDDRKRVLFNFWRPQNISRGKADSMYRAAIEYVKRYEL